MVRRRFPGGGGTAAGLLQRGGGDFAGQFGLAMSSLLRPVGYRETRGGGSSLPHGCSGAAPGPAAPSFCF
jgi:hypothetical protein